MTPELNVWHANEASLTAGDGDLLLSFVDKWTAINFNVQCMRWREAGTYLQSIFVVFKKIIIIFAV